MRPRRCTPSGDTKIYEGSTEDLMKTFAFVVAAAVLVISGLAQAQPTKQNVQTIEGNDARNVMLAMIGQSSTQWIENTVCITVVRNESKSARL